MGAAGADWLTREDREKFEQPDKVLDALKIQPGMTVADVGAGNGYFTLRLARRVKDSGRVFAVDIQQGMLDRLEINRKQEGLKNIELVLSTPTDPRLPPAAIDLALLVDVYHEFQQPEEMVAGIRASLKPEGVLVLVEYRGEDPSVPIKPEHKMTVAQVLREIEPMGFRLRKKLDFLPWQHIFIFEKKIEPRRCEDREGLGRISLMDTDKARHRTRNPKGHDDDDTARSLIKAFRDQ